jgi:beta-lactam-binding protein with PASTA domain
VVGMPVDQAEEALDRTGLRAVRRPVPNGDYPPGYVVDQDPGGSTEEAGGSTVTLGVSRSQPAEDPPPERTGPGATG